MTGQLTATIAAVLKRGWLDSSQQERHVFFTEVEAAVASHAGSAAARCAGVKILEVCDSSCRMHTLRYARVH